MTYNMPNVGLIVALHSEVPLLFRDSSIVHQLNKNLIKVVISGMGQKQATRIATSLCENKKKFSLDYLINLGACGATNDNLNIGDLIIANRLSYDCKEIQLTNMYIDNVKAIFQGTRHYIGKLQTFDWPVFSRSKVFEDTLAVDMESFAIGETSIKYQIPIVVVKVVSDIVPPKVNAINLWYQLKSMRNNKNHVHKQINEFAKHYFGASA